MQHLNQRMRFRKLMLLWLVFQIQIKDAYMTKWEVNKHLSNKNEEEEAAVRFKVTIKGFKANLSHPKIFSIISFLVQRFQEVVDRRNIEGDLSLNNINKRSKLVHSNYFDSLVHCYSCYF